MRSSTGGTGRICVAISKNRGQGIGIHLVMSGRVVSHHLRSVTMQIIATRSPGVICRSGQSNEQAPRQQAAAREKSTWRLSALPDHCHAARSDLRNRPVPKCTQSFSDSPMKSSAFRQKILRKRLNHRNRQHQLSMRIRRIRRRCPHRPTPSHPKSTLINFPFVQRPYTVQQTLFDDFPWPLRS